MEIWTPRRANLWQGVGMGTVLSEAGYARLLADVGALVASGQAEAEAKAGHVLAVTYWKVGDRIGREGLSERAGYGDGVMVKLADALGLSAAMLRRAVRFRTLYPAAPKPGLGWAHYQELLAVADPEARAFYEARALEAGWTKRVLREAIVERVFARGEEVLAHPVLVRPADGSFVYACEVVEVIDADTLRVHVDLGFDVVKVQTLRLAHVDAAEAKTEAGKRAAQWVRERLASALQVVARTEKPSDVHGRYVAHLFYSGEENATREWVFRHGRYLNAELLDAGLAEAASR